MKTIKWKKILNILFLAAVFGLTLWSVFHGEDFSQVLGFLSTADPLYIAPGIVCVVFFILGESIVIFYLMTTLDTRVPFSHCCLYSFIGFFYSCITPSASGGQPMQIVAMRKDRIPVAVSTVVLAIVTITYKLVLVLVGSVVILIRPPQLMIYLEPVEAILYLGMGLNIICIIGLLLLVFHPTMVQVASQQFFQLLHRVRPLSHPEKQKARLDRIIQQYQGSAEYYRSHKHVIIHVFFITLMQRFLLFLVTWFTYRAFHLSGHSLVLIVTLQSMISVASDMLPLPGGMGISENLFLDIFQPIFGEALVLPGMMISRGISYYTQLLISAAMTIAASFIIKEKQ
ncbi:MAG: YbhN family protein [Brotaphodocola sp.]